jgi:hypothetical protein
LAIIKPRIISFLREDINHSSTMEVEQRYSSNVKARFFAQKALPKENAVISTTAYGIDV